MIRSSILGVTKRLHTISKDNHPLSGFLVVKSGAKDDGDGQTLTITDVPISTASVKHKVRY